ncbi:MAG: HEPN domain-containing protein [Prevotella sp.]|nr:HEPN domain-containing protein [Candidatus Prevotella equi]
MSLTETEREIIVKREYEKAITFMEQAEGNATMGYWEVVANRMYYAVFHAVSALLIKDGHKVNTHRGTVMAYGQHYVKTGIVTHDEGSLYSQLQSMREDADYNCAFKSEPEKMKTLLPQAKTLISKIGNLLDISD